MIQASSVRKRRGEGSGIGLYRKINSHPNGPNLGGRRSSAQGKHFAGAGLVERQGLGEVAAIAPFGGGGEGCVISHELRTFPLQGFVKEREKSETSGTSQGLKSLTPAECYRVPPRRRRQGTSPCWKAQSGEKKSYSKTHKKGSTTSPHGGGPITKKTLKGVIESGASEKERSE